MFMLVRLYGPILRELQTNFEVLKNQSLNLLARDPQSPLLLDVLFQMIEIKYWYTLMRVRNRKILNPDSPQCVYVSFFRMKNLYTKSYPM